MMEKHRIKRLPVVRGQELVGIVSRANLLHALAGLARDIKPATITDQAIRERLLAELGRESWAPAAHRRTGAPSDHGGGGNVPGVQAVRDHLVWIEPTLGTVIYSSSDDPAQAKAS
ncbi:MAG: CBS domain-containing protein, partial [Xanthobacteraceae bacterium]